ncbi:MAG: WbqC family protein [Bacteroidetes bacterium]|nr:WbqC family protein [Bacteroidota bacterium]
MTKKIAIMQPTFNSWLGLFDMIDKVDTFVFYDDVQLTKRSWQVRNRILTTNGELFLTIPITKSAHRDEILILSAEINYKENWMDKHIKSIEMAYKKCPFYFEVFEVLEQHYQEKIKTLSEFNCSLINRILSKIGINTNTLRSSDLFRIEGTKDSRLVNICKSLGASTYLSACGSANYIELLSPGGEFTKHGINLLYHNYSIQSYPQIQTNKFVPYMGIFDLLFNVGFNEALAYIRKGREEDYGYLEYRKTVLNID